MQERRDAGQDRCRQEGYRTGGMQDRRDAGQERYRTGEMLDRRDAVHCKGEMLDRMDTSRMGYKTVWMQDWTDAEME